MNLTQFGIWNVLAQREREALEAALQAQGVAVYTLHGETIRDAASFFAQAGRDLLPGQRTGEKWDQLADRLRVPFVLSPGTESAILWTDAHVLPASDLTTLLHAFDLFLGLSRGLYNPTAAGEPRRIVRLFLLGDGPGFPPP